MNFASSAAFIKTEIFAGARRNNVELFCLFSSDFIASAGEHLHQSAAGIPMNKYVRSALNCQVVLDRLDEFAIDQIMKNSNRPVRISLVHESVDMMLLFI